MPGKIHLVKMTLEIEVKVEVDDATLEQVKREYDWEGEDQDMLERYAALQIARSAVGDGLEKVAKTDFVDVIIDVNDWSVDAV